MNRQNKRDAAAHVLRVWARHKIGELRAAGCSFAEIAEHLDEEGEPTARGGRWHKTSAARLVDRYRREVVPALDADGWPWVRLLRDFERADGDVTPAGDVQAFRALDVADLLEAGDVDLIADPDDIPAEHRAQDED